VTLKDRNGNVRTFDGKEEQRRQAEQKILQQTIKWGMRIVPAQMIFWWAFKILFSATLPGQLRIFSLLLSIPLIVAVMVLLGTLAPSKRGKKEGGGTLYAAMLHLVLTMELTTAVLWATGADQSSAYMQSEDQFYGRGMIFTFTTVIVGLIPYFLGFAVIGIILTVLINNLETYQWYDYTIKADMGVTAAFVIVKAGLLVYQQFSSATDIVEGVANISSA